MNARAEMIAACYASPSALMRVALVPTTHRCCLGYLVTRRGRGNWFYGHRAAGWGPGWESRHKVDPMRIGKARAARRRDHDGGHMSPNGMALPLSQPR